MSKVIVRIKGGLGNQLFCYAAALRLALVNQAELVLDDVSGFAQDHQYRRQYQLGIFDIGARRASAAERLEPASRLRRRLLKWSSGRAPFASRRYLDQEFQDFDPRLLAYRVRGTVRLEGYWQSEGYFKDVEAILRRDLQMSAPGDQANRDLGREIEACNSVMVHVRWFDDPGGQQAARNLERDYYLTAIRELQEKTADPHFFLFSDNPAAARDLLGLPEGQVTVIDHNQGPDGAGKDLWLMRRCRHFIIANSTFSWWGAWLSTAEGKIVFAPARAMDGVAAWGFRGLIPEDWLLR
jgi:hypothetical protein